MFCPAFSAQQRLGYVLPSHPHTGLNISLQKTPVAFRRQ